MTGGSSETWARAAIVAAASLLLGAATFLAAQGSLPDALTSFANSASGWTLVTVLLLNRIRLRAAVAARVVRSRRRPARRKVFAGQPELSLRNRPTCSQG